MIYANFRVHSGTVGNNLCHLTHPESGGATASHNPRPKEVRSIYIIN